MKAFASLKHASTFALLLTATVTLVSETKAIPIPPGSYYTDVVGGGIGSAPLGYVRNDDESFGAYPLGFGLSGLTIFGSTYSDFWINNNGNISFGAPTSTKTDDPLDTTTEAPMIAPYWADVDTRPVDGGTVSLRSEPNQIIVTWDLVGYYDQHTDKTASFQLVLRGPDYLVPSDEGRVGFFYRDLGWETGDAQGGVGGFGGIEASAGFSDGLASVNPGEFVFPLSGQAGIGQSLSNNHYWFGLIGAEGVPVLQQITVPEPATLVLLAIGMLGLAAARRRHALTIGRPALD